MSHIHIPDGVLPIWLVIIGWITTAVILYLCIRRVRNVQLVRKIPLIGIVSAIMIVGMTLEIVPIAYHINMSVIAGIVLGPALGFISVFIVDLMIAMIGHGGFTVVGLNTLIVGTEAVLGFYFFHAFLGLLSSSKISAGLSAALATMLSLIISTSLMIGIVYLSQVNPQKILHVDKESFIGKVFSLGPHRENEKYEIRDKKIDIETFAKTVFFLGVFGWVLETLISGFVIRYVSRVRPDLILSEAT
ncbi:MAG: energy-coupling factor ABC transporter permease [Thermodesulfobacteriota bacterium]